MKLFNATVSYEAGEVIYTGLNETGNEVSVYGPTNDDKLLLGLEYQNASQEQRPMQLNNNEQIN